MGISGEQYDKFSGPEYTPNKDRRMAEWRKKKESERTADLEKKGQEEAKRSAEAEDKPEIKSVTTDPISSDDGTLLNAINNSVPGAELKKTRSRRKHFNTGHQPTLFDGVE
jgi:hypothetical protein